MFCTRSKCTRNSLIADAMEHYPAVTRCRLIRVSYKWPWKAGSSSENIPEDLRNYAPTVWAGTTQFAVGVGVFSEGPTRPHLKGEGCPTVPYIGPCVLGTPTYVHTVWPRATKFCMVTRGEESVSMGQPLRQIRGCLPHCPPPPNFWECACTAFSQWHRSVVKLGGQRQLGLCQVKSSNCFRRLEKLVLPSIFDTSFILHDVKLAELSNNSFEWKYDILGEGVKTHSGPSYIF